MSLNPDSLGRIAQDTLESLASVRTSSGMLPLESTSNELSPLQKEYKSFFKGQLAEHGFEVSPFEGTVDETSTFFRHLTERWKTRRAEFEAKNGTSSEAV